MAISRGSRVVASQGRGHGSCGSWVTWLIGHIGHGSQFHKIQLVVSSAVDSELACETGWRRHCVKDLNVVAEALTSSSAATSQGGFRHQSVSTLGAILYTQRGPPSRCNHCKCWTYRTTSRTNGSSGTL